jgi:hypothetical protein
VIWGVNVCDHQLSDHVSECVPLKAGVLPGNPEPSIASLEVILGLEPSSALTMLRPETRTTSTSRVELVSPIKNSAKDAVV